MIPEFLKEKLFSFQICGITLFFGFSLSKSFPIFTLKIRDGGMIHIVLGMVFCKIKYPFLKASNFYLSYFYLLIKLSTIKRFMNMSINMYIQFAFLQSQM